MNAIVDVTPEPAAAPAAQPEFTDSAQSVDQLIASASSPDGQSTSMRLFAFRPEGTTERLALVFVGPEAVNLSQMFCQYADALFNSLEARKETFDVKA